MPIKQVVVVTKLSAKDLRWKTRVVHLETLKRVVDYLKRLPIRFKMLNRNYLKKTIKADLIISVGGDGTVLATSHFAGQSPILGINSAPQTSTGFYCLANVKNFELYLRRILKGKLKPRKIPRLRASINGKRVTPFGLNDILFASRLQGETARYRIRISKKGEVHKSSGVWVATGAGSTAAIYSAGGKKDSPSSKRIQYLVREPCRFPKNHYQLLKGFLNPSQKIKITPEINQGMILIDGGRWHYPIPKNGSLIITGGVCPLRLYL